MLTRKAGPALAVGCTFVMKPASETPLSAMALVELAERAGMPAGVLNLVVGKSSKSIGDTFIQSPVVRKMTFTGSTAVGKQLLNEKAVSSVDALVKDAFSKGATALAGGSISENGSCFYNPTVLTNVSEDMRVHSEEIIGPVAPLFKFSSEEQAIAMANDTEFGLASYIFTNDLGRIWRVSEALEYGMVGVNEVAISSEVIPFGGIKESGLGREGSRHGVEDYLETKYICMGGLQ